MLKKCDLSCIQEDVPAIAVGSLLASYFSDSDEAVVLWESIKEFRLVSLSAFSFPKYWVQDCLRLIVSSDSCEIRLESGVTSFSCRILKETADQGSYIVRQDNLLLRKTGSIEAELFSGGRGRMAHREYFIEDEDGMLTFYADRLAGTVVTSGEESK